MALFNFGRKQPDMPVGRTADDSPPPPPDSSNPQPDLPTLPAVGNEANAAVPAIDPLAPPPVPAGTVTNPISATSPPESIARPVPAGSSPAPAGNLSPTAVPTTPAPGGAPASVGPPPLPTPTPINVIVPDQPPVSDKALPAGAADSGATLPMASPAQPAGPNPADQSVGAIGQEMTSAGLTAGAAAGPPLTAVHRVAGSDSAPAPYEGAGPVDNDPTQTYSFTDERGREVTVTTTSSGTRFMQLAGVDPTTGQPYTAQPIAADWRPDASNYDESDRLVGSPNPISDAVAKPPTEAPRANLPPATALPQTQPARFADDPRFDTGKMGGATLPPLGLDANKTADTNPLGGLEPANGLNGIAPPPGSSHP